ncbi:MAG: sigma-70 family RNA polymerase sigma factor [Planctomycetota bacterium]|nr:sigma-70 family RNA polymerase sigma factor [Planctomycetota bacterium]
MWSNAPQTEELLAQAQTGDASAVNNLLERHRNSLQQLVRIRLDQKIRGRVGVSDVVQDVLVEANRRFERYLENPVMPFHLWLRHIARDRIIDAHRRHRGTARRSVDREQNRWSPPGHDQSSFQLASILNDKRLTPAAAAIQREMSRRVEQSLSKLDEKDSEIIVMRHYEMLTNQEVAMILDLTEPAASMRYLRAIRRLKDVFLKDAPNGSDGVG